MKTLLAMIVGTLALSTAGVALAQSGRMMHGGSWGIGQMVGFGGIWGPIVLVVAAVGLLVWVVRRERE